MPLYGGIEAGGTKFVCIIAGGPDDVRLETRFPTTTPEETMRRTVEFFREGCAKLGENIVSLGVGSFGPVGLRKDKPDYGYVTSTPKPGWRNAPVAPVLEKELNIPVIFDTDVNTAALGESLWGAARGLKNAIYLTFGTGVGGGIISNGEPIRGLVHPEVGHILLPHDRLKDPFEGFCPYHGDCLEGLTAGPAIEKRWKTRAENLPVDHPAWDLEAEYIAAALHAFICCYSPERIILGGGVMQQEQLFPLIRAKTLASLSGYVQAAEILEHIDTYIVPPLLGSRAGSLGAIALAMQALG